MNKQIIIQRTINPINHLPEDKAKAISDFEDFISKKYEDQLLVEGITNLTLNSKAFDFLKDEEDLYTITYTKEPYKA